MKESLNLGVISPTDEPSEKTPVQTLVSLGAVLKEEREKQGFTLDYLADKTKIRHGYLEGIESGDLEGFYGAVYKRGFVKCYLETLGRLDLWEDYDRLLKKEKEASPTLQTPPLGEFTPPARGFRKGSRRSIFVGLIAVILAAGWYLWSNRENIKAEVAKIQQEQLLEAQKAKEAKEKKDLEAKLAAEAEAKAKAEAEEAARKAEEERVLAPKSVPVSSDLSSDIASGLLEPEQKAEPVLTVTAVRNSWIRITREGERIFGGTLKVGESKEVPGTGRIHVIYGRPESLKVTWNGKDTDPSKEGAGPIHFLYSPDGTSKAVTSQEAEILWSAPISADFPPVSEEVKASESSEIHPVLAIRAVRGDCWIHASQGDNVLYTGTMKLGGEVSVDLKEDIKVVFGNPSAVTVTLDGREIGYVGKASQISRTIYSPDGSKREAPKR